jgi:hypothetical protein
MSVSKITLTDITVPDISSKTIRAFGQVTFSSGTYTTGGLAMGLTTYADNKTIDFNNFLRCTVWGEDVITTSPPVGGYSFHYSPTGDVLQILLNGTELGNGASVPAAVLNDTTLFEAIWDRSVARG